MLEDLNRRASERIDALRQAHGREVEDLSSAQQSRYKNILRQAPDPSPVAIRLPSVALFARGQESLPEHIYADASGEAPIYLNNWELDSIRGELAKSGVLGWLRSVDREGWALCVPWRDGNTWRGFFPDFIVVRDDGDGPRAHIIDPHDHTKPDAVGKGKGLSAYAHKHADQLGHIDLVAKIDGRYRRLHLEKAAIRKQVDALQTLNELRGLYVREG